MNEEMSVSSPELKDGFYDAVVRDVCIIENRFDPSQGYEVQIECGVFDDQRRPLCKCEAYLELSARLGVGNNSNKTNYAISMEKLSKLGFQGGDDLSRIEELKGASCRLQYQTVDKNGVALKYGPRWLLTFSRPVRKVDAKTAMATIKQMMAGVSGIGTPPPPVAGAFNMPQAPVAPAAPIGDPFANL